MVKTISSSILYIYILTPQGHQKLMNMGKNPISFTSRIIYSVNFPRADKYYSGFCRELLL